MRICILAAAVLLGCVRLVVAQDPSAASASDAVTVSIAARGLERPVAVVCRRGDDETPAEVFVLEGSRIVRRLPEGPKPLVAELPDGFVASLNGMLMVGPERLVVGVKWQQEGAAGEPALLVYRVSESESATPTQRLAAPRVDGDRTRAAPLALAENGRYLFAAMDDGGILRARFSSGGVGELKAFRSLEGVKAQAAAFSNQGYLVVAIADESGAVLTFHHPYDATQPEALRVETELEDLRGLAYGFTPRPSDRRLYAIDGRPAQQGGGVYRIDAHQRGGVLGCDTVRIASIDRPTSLAFATENVLFVTAEGDESGILVRLEGAL